MYKNNNVGAGSVSAQRGITLIALVITIIVMLILVGVTISMAVNGGLFEYAGKAVGDTQNALDEEQQLADGRIQIGGVWYDSIDDYLAGKPSPTVKITLSIAGTKVTTVPVPTGFTHTEGTIDTGYVIQDADGNEFVWVPVDKNQKITLSLESEKDIKELNLIDPYGDVILTIEDGDIETTYSNTEINPTVNGVYIAQVSTEGGLVEKTLTVRSLYAKDSWNDIYLSDEIYLKQTNGELDKETFWQAQAGETDLETFIEQAGCRSLDQYITVMLGTNMKTSYGDGVDIEEHEESNSIEKNGGFYVARYEAGATTARTSGNATDTAETIISANGIPVSKQGAYPYNNVTYDQAKGLAENMYSSSEYTVSLLTGTAWDRILSWLNETGDKSAEEITLDSSSWGNYSNAEFEITKGKYYSDFSWTEVSGTYTKADSSGILLTTGATTRNSANNIFDLAGNVREWTNEAKNSNSRGVRGGRFDVNGSFDSALGYGDTGDPTISNSVIGFRVALYIK